jgi:magnesium-transporting ATPase (P-type)
VWCRVGQIRESCREPSQIRYNPFSSKRKKMSVLVTKPDGYVLYVKGAGKDVSFVSCTESLALSVAPSH